MLGSGNPSLGQNWRTCELWCGTVGEFWLNISPFEKSTEMKATLAICGNIYFWSTLSVWVVLNACSDVLLVMIAVIAFCWRWRWGGGRLLHLSCSWYKCVSGGQYGCSGARWSDTKLCIWESQSWWRRHEERSPIHVDPLPLPHPDHLGHSLHHSSRSAPDTPAILAMHFYLKQDIVFTDQELFSV